MNEMWAKVFPRKTLLHHMLDTGFMGKVLLQSSNMRPILKRLEELIPGRDICDTIACIIALHDLGKCHPYFQGRDPSYSYVHELFSQGKLSIQQKVPYRHEIGSKYMLEAILKDQGLSPKSLKMLGSILRLHHQKGVQQKRELRIPENMDRIFWEEEQNRHFKQLCDVFHPDFNIFNDCTNKDAVAVLVWGCTILSDWLASGQIEFQRIDGIQPLHEYEKESLKAAELVLKSVGLQNKNCLAAVNFCDMWRDIPPDGLRPLQVSCSALASCWHSTHKAPGFVLLEAPMGEGKTEAGLFLAAHLMKAYGKTGFYIALPTAATSNNMYERVQRLLSDHGKVGAKLMHAQAWLIEGQIEYAGETDDAQEVAAWLSPLRRGMLSQYAVGTVDQVMMAVLRIKYGILRLVGAASKVIVIDEVHAYDAYMLAIIERLLEWCAALAIPVVMLSATLPIERRNRLISAYAGETVISASQAYPQITTIEKNGFLQELTVPGTFMNHEVGLDICPLLGVWEEVAHLAISRVSQDGCLCILVNTVNEAQTLFQTLQVLAPSTVSLFLIHARFPAQRRQEIEEECLSAFGKEGNRPQKAILVATQVVEQSLDLDFDSMITALAPIDLLLQRIGRIHRHMWRIRPAKMKTPAVTVLVPGGDLAGTPTASVYSPWILKQTMEALYMRGSLRLPEDIRPLVEQVYEARPQSEDAAFEDWAKLAFQNEVLHENAQPVLYPKPNTEYFFAAENEGIFFDEESDDLSYRGARTRMGEESLRIAVISIDLAQKTKSADKTILQSILAKTVSVPSKRLSGRMPHPDYMPEMVGDGLLRGILLLPSDNHQYAFIKNGKTLVLVIDDILGLIFKEE